MKNFDMLESQIADMARRVEANPDFRKVLSADAQIAVAFVLDKSEWLAEVGCKTIIDVETRLSGSWMLAAMEVKAQGWR